MMTHNSIGLGEDGPTHQTVEHLSALRDIPRLAVYRPGDPIETTDCWEAILDGPREKKTLGPKVPTCFWKPKGENGN